jgi:hypothetical protein
VPRSCSWLSSQSFPDARPCQHRRVVHPLGILLHGSVRQVRALDPTLLPSQSTGKSRLLDQHIGDLAVFALSGRSWSREVRKLSSRG